MSGRTLYNLSPNSNCLIYFATEFCKDVSLISSCLFHLAHHEQGIKWFSIQHNIHICGVALGGRTLYNLSPNSNCLVYFGTEFCKDISLISSCLFRLAFHGGSWKRGFPEWLSN
jgi:hypothetical protein